MMLPASELKLAASATAGKLSSAARLSAAPIAEQPVDDLVMISLIAKIRFGLFTGTLAAAWTPWTMSA
jgi:hypothetical protein